MEAVLYGCMTWPPHRERHHLLRTIHHGFPCEVPCTTACMAPTDEFRTPMSPARPDVEVLKHVELGWITLRTTAKAITAQKLFGGWIQDQGARSNIG